MQGRRGYANHSGVVQEMDFVKLERLMVYIVVVLKPLSNVNDNTLPIFFQSLEVLLTF
jgi:hypothetical protein